MNVSSLVRVQEKGQVTIPLPIRRKLGVGKGDFVTFVETDEGFIIRAAEVSIKADEQKSKKKKAT